MTEAKSLSSKLNPDKVLQLLGAQYYIKATFQSGIFTTRMKFGVWLDIQLAGESSVIYKVYGMIGEQRCDVLLADWEISDTSTDISRERDLAAFIESKISHIKPHLSDISKHIKLNYAISRIRAIDKLLLKTS